METSIVCRLCARFASRDGDSQLTVGQPEVHCARESPLTAVRIVCGFASEDQRDKQMNGDHFLALVFICHAIVRGSRLLPELIRPRSSRAFTVLRLADAGRITSSSFKRRKTGLPPSESVSSWYPCSMCQTRSCSVSVSLGRSAPAFFFAVRAPPNPGGWFNPLDPALLQLLRDPGAGSSLR